MEINIVVELLSVLFVILWLVYWYLTKNYNYWEKRGVPYKKAEFPFGSLKDVVLTRTFLGKGHDDIYKTFPGERFYGVIDFRKPTLVIRDPEMIKNVLVKDFECFVDRPVLLTSAKDYMILHLLNLKGQEWKDMRMKLTPTFTSGKMKLMFPLMEKCSETLKDHLESEIKDRTNIIDAKNILARFTMDVIASCAFGIDTHSLTEKNSEFFRVLGRVTKTTILRYVRRLCLIFFPFLIKLFRINIIRPEVRDFVTNLVRDNIEFRQKNNVKRNDFLDLLMNIKHNKNNENGNTNSDHKDENEGLTIEQMAAQTFIFFVAGFETSSSVMAFCLYELSRHRDIQEKLYQDTVDAVDKNNGKISYQVLMEIPFLDQVINETLRLYGAAQVLSRVCTKPYAVPDSDLVLDQGMKVVIPLYSLHHDPRYYPHPYAFKPERFTVEESKKRHPYVYLPFGEGPRHCIGVRFGQMQAKIGLATILLSFQVDPSPNQEAPIEIDKRAVGITMPANPVLLKFTKRRTT